MFARASQTARPVLRAGTKVLFRALWKQSVSRIGSPVGAAAIVIGILVSGPLVVAGIAVIAVAASVGVGREIASQRTLVAKALQRLGLGRLTGFSRFEDLSPTVNRLLEQAWEGHHTRRIADLEQLTQSADRLESQCAHLALADWFITHGDPERATHHLDAARTQSMRRTRVDLESLAIEAWSITTPNTPPPDLRMERALVRNVDTGFLLANREAGARRLDHYNRLLQSDGFATVEAPNEALASLSCPTPPAPITDSPKVTVIVPAHQAENTIGYALDSVRNQTWRNLEVIVVDDASTDATADIVASIDDPRIRLVRNDINLGTYRSRNKALQLATGDYVTVHDADDWCHPERIATQMHHLQNHPKVVANLTGLVRATEDLTFVRRDLTHSQVIGVNTSSMLMKGEALVAVGGWDELLSAADSELIERLRALHGENAVEFVLRRTPLAVTLKSAASLTSSAATGLASRVSQIGARHLYAMAFRNWHQSPPFRADLPLAR
ncbi:MAG: glycosyltransferase family A protein, partial [Ilumatobacteraceae bacterium]